MRANGYIFVKLHDIDCLSITNLHRYYQLCNRTSRGLAVYSFEYIHEAQVAILCSGHVSPTGDHLFNLEVP